MAEPSLSRPSASASGTIASTPLVHLLLYTADKKLSGTIELALAGKRPATASILLVKGDPAKVKTSDPAPYLGGVLLEMGKLTEEQHTRSLADLAKAKGQGALHGQVLLESRYIDEETLEAGLREQVARKLRQVAAMAPETTFAFYQGYDGLKSWGPAMAKGFDPLPMLWGMLRENRPAIHVTAAVERVAKAPLRLASTAELNRLGLSKDEQAAAALLRVRPMRAADLVSTCGLPAAEAQLLVYLLLITKQVEVVKPVEKKAVEKKTVEKTVNIGAPGPAPAAKKTAAPPPPPRGTSRPARPPPSPGTAREPTVQPPPPAAGSALPPPPRVAATRASPPPPRAMKAPAQAGPISIARGVSAPAPGLTPQLAERWREIVDKAEILDRMDHFTLLGVSQNASRDEVESTFLALAKRWHPDRVPKELAAVRDECSRVFARMSEARTTLTNDEQRTKYVEEVAAGGGSRESEALVHKILGAASTFEKAELAFKRHDFDEAAKLARKASEDDPSQADYLALLAWILSHKPEHRSAEGTQECIEMLDRALKISDRCEKAYFWRGMLQKRAGKNTLAAKDFKRAVDLNPQNVDAVREMRLFTMRAGQSDGPRSPQTGGPRRDADGLFGKMFKK
jgi:tetratricopeptide (TPR) repeat protein